MLVGFGVALAIGFSIVSGPTLLETRFGSFGSVFFDISSTTTNTGALNSALAGLSPNAVTAAISRNVYSSYTRCCWNRNDDNVMYVILTLFIVGLMVGKTPEFMSMKISVQDIKLAVFIFLLHPAIILIPTVIAFTTGSAQQVSSDGNVVTPMSYTQALYEFASSGSK